MQSPFERENTQPNQPHDDVVIEEAGSNEDTARAATPAWLVSLGLHGSALALMAALVFATKEAEVIYPPPKIYVVPEIQKPEAKKPPVLDDPTDLKIKTEEEFDISNPIAFSETEPVETVLAESEIPDVGNPGHSDAVSTMATGSTAMFMAIGAGGGSPGMFSNRKGPGKQRINGKYPTAIDRTNSIEAALRWFKRHQSANGMWDVDAYHLNCQEPGTKCEPGKEQAGNADVACTAYAISCFLGMGYDHKTPNKYRMVVEKGINWLLEQQTAEGVFGDRNYEHAIATMTIAEAFGVSRDMTLRAPAQKAVDVILARQAQDPKATDGNYARLGWDYKAPKPQRIDTSVTGWNVMALKSALGAGLSVGNSMEGAKRWLERTWKASNPNWEKLDPYKDESTFPYTFDAITEQVGNHKDGEGKLACVGAICAMFLDHHQGDPVMETLANYIMNHNYPQSYPTNTYFLYYNTMAIFQCGEERWKKWDKHVSQLLANAQRKDDSCYNGSWDFAGTQFHGHETGRLLSTAYACLSQEVIWRYQQLNRK